MTTPPPDRRFPVNITLTQPNQRKRTRHVDNTGYAAFLTRAVRAHGRRVATTGDIEALTELVNLQTELTNTITHAVVGLRNHGYSWAEIAHRLGITKQAAQQRWGKSPIQLPPDWKVAQ